MADRPILFSGPMVRAILDGRKTQTRRVLKPQPPDWCSSDKKPGYSVMTPRGHIEFRGVSPVDGYGAKFIKLPYTKGDRLWVREAWRTGLAYEDLSPSEMGGEEQILFEADGATERWTRGSSAPGRFRQGKHMPRWASRLTLIVTDIRVQRLQEISAGDALAEGVRADMPPTQMPPFRGGLPIATPMTWNDGRDFTSEAAFKRIWNSINAKRPGCSWDDNPWVVAVTFRAINQNIDSIGDGDDH